MSSTSRSIHYRGSIILVTDHKITWLTHIYISSLIMTIWENSTITWVLHHRGKEWWVMRNSDIRLLWFVSTLTLCFILKAPYPGMEHPPQHPYYQHHPPPPQAHPPYSGHHPMPHDARFREKRVVRSFASSLVMFSHSSAEECAR